MTMVEARRAERVRSFLRARIMFNHNNSTIDCVVKNLSTTGAKLEVASTISIPSEFDLDIPQKGRVFRVRMMWRDATSLGVQFIAGTAEQDAPETRLEKLERENRKLKSMVATLTKRLEDLGQDVSWTP